MLDWQTKLQIKESDSSIQILFAKIDHVTYFTCPNNTVYPPKKVFKSYYNQLTSPEVRSASLEECIDCSLIYCEYLLFAAQNCLCIKKREAKQAKAQMLLDYLLKLNYHQPKTWKLQAHLYN